MFSIRGPAKYIAKAYVYCPGREVRLLVNNISSHLFQNTKRAEVVIGGAKDGVNEMQFSIKDIEGGDPECLERCVTSIADEKKAIAEAV